LERVTDDLKDVGKAESHPRLEGRVMSAVLAPLK